MTARKSCFVISPIGAEGSDVRKRADQIFRHVINPAAEACGFAPVRADHISEPGLITTQIIQHVLDDELVIADLTGSNPNVFYELAIRHAIRKPLVQIIQKDEKIPFDVAGMRTIPVDHRDLDSVQEAKSEIEKQVKAVLSRKPGDIESPISMSVELQSLRQSDKPEDRSLAEFVSAIADLRTDVAGIEKRLGNPHTLLPPEYLSSILRETRDSRGRRVDREAEAMMFHLTSRLEELAKSLDGKTSSKEATLEISRLRETINAMRHDLRLL